MNMLNQAAVEALCSATYLENYLDCMDNLPDDLQRSVSSLRELDSQTADLLQDISAFESTYLGQRDSPVKKKALLQIQRALLKTRELGDEKLQVVSHIIENVENRSRQLEQDLENLDPGSALGKHDHLEPDHLSIATAGTVSIHKTGGGGGASSHRKHLANSGGGASGGVTAHVGVAQHHDYNKHDKASSASLKRHRRQRQNDAVKDEDGKKQQAEDDKPKKKKKRKVKNKEKTGEKSPNLELIDPDEPTYCLCDQVSYGEMIGCDNDSCAIEWFHFNCVNLTNKPKGKWYCPKCRGDKPTVKRTDIK